MGVLNVWGSYVFYVQRCYYLKLSVFYTYVYACNVLTSKTFYTLSFQFQRERWNILLRDTNLVTCKSCLTPGLSDSNVHVLFISQGRSSDKFNKHFGDKLPIEAIFLVFSLFYFYWLPLTIHHPKNTCTLPQIHMHTIPQNTHIKYIMSSFYWLFLLNVLLNAKNHKEGWALKNWCFQTGEDSWTESSLRVPWTARRSNQSTVKKINHG